MQTVLTRLSRPQVETIQQRFPAAIKARAIIVKGATVTFAVPADAQIWDGSPLHVGRALLMSEVHQGDTSGKGGLNSLIARVAQVSQGGTHRDVRVHEDTATEEKESA